MTEEGWAPPGGGGGGWKQTQSNNSKKPTLHPPAQSSLSDRQAGRAHTHTRHALAAKSLA